MKFRATFRPRTVLAPVGALALLIGAEALAQTTVHATGSAGISYTDNLLGAPSEARPGAAPRISTFYLTLTPGLALYHNRERSRFLLTYDHPFLFYLGNSRNNTSGDVVAGQGVWLMSMHDELMIGISASRMTRAAMLGTASTGQVAAVGDSRTRMFTLGIDEQWSHAFTERWHGRQFNSFYRAEALSGPAALPTRSSVSAGAALDYSFERNAVGLQSAATYHWMGYVPIDQTPPSTFADSDTPVRPISASRRQLIVDSFAQYRRDLSVSWSWQARLGVVTSFNLESQSYTAPRWGSSLLWQREALHGTLSYDHLVTTNVLTGLGYQTDVARLTFSWPLLESAHLNAVVGTGVSRNRSLMAEQQLSPVRTLVLTADAAINYAPDEELPQVSLTYMHFEQRAQGGSSPLVPSFARNTISLFVSGHFPSRAFYDVPRAAPQRVDAADRNAPPPR